MKQQIIDTLKINYMSQLQYDRELAAGRINRNELYVTPEPGVMREVATLTTEPYFDYTYDENTDDIMKLYIGDKYATDDRMLLLKKHDEMGGVHEENSLCAQLEAIFNARMVSISVLAGDFDQLSTPLIYKETVGSTKMWAGSCYDINAAVSDSYIDTTHLLWTDNPFPSMAGGGPYALYMKLSSALYDAIKFAYADGIDVSPGVSKLVFTAYN